MIPARNIFLIDDDELFIFLTRKSIRETNLTIQITEFSDGESAIEHLKGIMGNTELLPDVIFLDLSMPIMDGWEFLEEYLLIEPGFGKQVKLYIFSSSISPHDMERAKNIDTVAEFVIKPLKKEKIKELLTR